MVILVLKNIPFLVCYCFAFMAFCLAQMASAQNTDGFRPHVTVNLGSYHHNPSRDFNEFNPGFGFGVTGPAGLPSTELGAEIGQYKNSLNEQSYYLMGSLEREAFAITSAMRLRLGVFAGFARYAGSANKFKGHGVPTIGDWVLGLGLQSTLRMSDTYDLRLRAMPAGHVADALFTAQLAVRY